MRLLFVANTSSLYGANRSMINLIEYLKECGDEIYVLLPGTGPVISELKRLGCIYFVESYRPCAVPPTYRGLPFIANFIVMPKLYFRFRKLNIDIIHTNSSTHDIGILLAILLKKPHVWHIREVTEHYNIRYFFPGLYKKLREKSDSVICISNYIYSKNAELYSASNMMVVYNGFTLPIFGQVEHDIHSLLICGAITKNKGQEEAINALNIIVNDKKIQDIHLTIAGDGSEDYINYLNGMINGYRLSDYIEIIPFQKDLSELRKKSGIALQCSRMEGMGRVTIESMLVGLLVIGGGHGATLELIKDGFNGYLYPPGCTGELAEKIVYAFGHEYEVKQIVNNARQWAETSFGNEVAGAKIRTEYERILGRGK